MSTTATVKSRQLMTADEFLAWSGDGHVGKLELVEGVVRAMAPASPTHSIIQANLARLIGNHLVARKSLCRVGTEAPVLARMYPKRNVRVPELAVTCAPLSSAKTFELPTLIVEVLSPSNDDDTWESIHAMARCRACRRSLWSTPWSAR